MRIEPTQNNFKAYQINAKENKEVKFLFNKVSEVLTQEQQTITFATDFIKFNKLTDKMKLAFEKLKIKVNEVK